MTTERAQKKDGQGVTRPEWIDPFTGESSTAPSHEIEIKQTDENTYTWTDDQPTNNLIDAVEEVCLLGTTPDYQPTSGEQIPPPFDEVFTVDCKQASDFIDSLIAGYQDPESVQSAESKGDLFRTFIGRMSPGFMDRYRERILEAAKHHDERTRELATTDLQRYVESLKDRILGHALIAKDAFKDFEFYNNLYHDISHQFEIAARYGVEIGTHYDAMLQTLGSLAEQLPLEEKTRSIKLAHQMNHVSRLLADLRRDRLYWKRKLSSKG